MDNKRIKAIKRRCKLCQEVLKGRSDKKFCDFHCRNAYNNKHKSEEQRKIITINKYLKKNRSILKSLCPSGRTVVKKEVLDALGFRLQYFTGIYRSSQKPSIVLLLYYDYSIEPTIENGIRMVSISSCSDSCRDFIPNIWKV